MSDIELPQMQNVPYLRRSYADVDIVVSCGDLPVSYIEFVTSVLNVPLFYVRGNHDEAYDYQPPGGDSLHRRTIVYQGVSFAGLEGCKRYNQGLIQYSEFEMYWNVLGMAPGMLMRRARQGYGVDVMVTHAPPLGIHDRSDRPHQGFRALLLLMRWYRPRYLIHGHVDVLDRRETTQTQYRDTQVININPLKALTIAPLSR